MNTQAYDQCFVYYLHSIPASLRKTLGPGSHHAAGLAEGQPGQTAEQLGAVAAAERAQKVRAQATAGKKRLVNGGIGTTPTSARRPGRSCAPPASGRRPAASRCERQPPVRRPHSPRPQRGRAPADCGGTAAAGARRNRGRAHTIAITGAAMALSTLPGSRQGLRRCLASCEHRNTKRAGDAFRLVGPHFRSSYRRSICCGSTGSSVQPFWLRASRNKRFSKVVVLMASFLRKVCLGFVPVSRF